MLTIKERGILENIIKHCNKIEEKTKNLTYEKFLENEDLVDLVCFHILQIGELVKSFDKNFYSAFPEQPWSKIKGMRDVVAHGYGTIKRDEVWFVVANQIQSLNNYCNEILDTNLNNKEVTKQSYIK